MEVSPVGIVLLPIGMICFLLRPSWVFYLLLLTCGFSATALINVTALTFGLQPYHYFAALFLLSYLFGRFRIPADPVSGNLAILLAAYLCALLMSLLPLAGTGELRIINLTQTMIMVLGVLTLAGIAFRCARPENLVTAMNFYVTGGVFVALWGVVQIACETSGLDYPDWLFNNSISDSADFFDQSILGQARISSVAVEPSFFARFAVGAAGIALVLAEVSRGGLRAWYLTAALLLVTTAVLSTSTSAYVGLTVLLVPWAMLSIKRTVIAVGSAGVVLAGLSVLAPARIGAILETTLSKASSGSYYERTETIRTALIGLDDHLFLGVGMAELKVYDLFIALLHHTGLFGMVSFLLVLLFALWGEYLAPAHRGAIARNCALRRGIRLTLLAVIAIDVVSGLSYVAANLWVLLGFSAGSIWSVQRGGDGAASTEATSSTRTGERRALP